MIYLAGQVALLKGEGERAVKLLNAAAAEQPRNAQVLATLGSAYQQQGHSAFAEQSLRRALQLDPGQTRWRRLLVETLISQNRHNEAEVELATYRQHHPQELGGLVLHAEMLVRAASRLRRSPISAPCSSSRRVSRVRSPACRMRCWPSPILHLRAARGKACCGTIPGWTRYG